jgi:DNA-binding transcriptional ArsR family regulator
MKEGPDISRLASLIGDPARANMLTALMDGRALTASELASQAGVTKQTASAHLGKLLDGGLLAREIQGRHHYFRLDGADIAEALEALMGVAAKRSGKRTRTGPKDPALRKARICYDHLAGEMGVLLFDRLLERGWLERQGDGPDGEIALTPPGDAALEAFGLELAPLTAKRRQLCRSCLDWSMRRHHLAGSLGQSLLQHFEALTWARRLPDTRIIAFTPPGERAFLKWLG